MLAQYFSSSAANNPLWKLVGPNDYPWGRWAQKLVDEIERAGDEEFPGE